MADSTATLHPTPVGQPVFFHAAVTMLWTQVLENSAILQILPPVMQDVNSFVVMERLTQAKNVTVDLKISTPPIVVDPTANVLSAAME